MISVNNKRIESILTNALNNGGYSISLKDSNDSFNSGYFVSIDETEIIIDLSKGTQTRQAIKNFIFKNRNLLNESNKVLGLWINKGQLYIDVSTQIKSLKLALTCGLLHNQKAIFDNETKTEINV